MRLFEIEEAGSIVSNINGLLLIFTSTPKTNRILKEYLQNLILELQDQDLIDESVDSDSEEVIDLSPQINFLKYLLDTLEAKEHVKVIIDKTSN